ncbi:MAG: 1-acyl-sn-glycerol-3-phosphate acyltransferase [Hydrogenophilus sp.]|nr:1-acyl-sn-glycerol-3-phosphate acyltransferase [Hydrogenophilus sp.]
MGAAIVLLEPLSPSSLRAWVVAPLRLLGLLFWLLVGLSLTLFVSPWVTQATRDALKQRWARGVLAALGVTLETRGMPSPGALWVANHISWLDIPVLLAILPARFVAKAEVRRWPLLGWLAACHGTLFLARRSRQDTARIGRAVQAALTARETVVIFPEGTTTDGTSLRPFHSSLFEGAVAASAPVQPVALEYRTAEGKRTVAAAFVGTMTFWQTLRNILGAAPLVAAVTFGEPFTGQNRKLLTRSAEQAIATMLSLPSPTPRALYSSVATATGHETE